MNYVEQFKLYLRTKRVKISAIISMFVLLIVPIIKFFSSISVSPHITYYNLVFLGSIILYIVFDIHDHISKSNNTIKKDNHKKMQPLMARVIEESLSGRGETTIRVMGASMHYSLKFLIDVLTPYLKSKRNNKGKLTLIFELLDEKWAAENGIEMIHKRADDFDSKIKEWKEKYEGKGDFSVDVYEFKSLPIIHGILVNNETLFQSICQFELQKNGKCQLTVGDNTYEMIKHNNEAEGDKVKQFGNLFNYFHKNERIVNHLKFSE